LYTADRSLGYIITMSPTTLQPTPEHESASISRNTAAVLHVINGEHYSGAERVQDLLARHLHEFGYRVGFACLKLGKFEEMRQSQAAPLTNIPMRSRWDVSAAWKLVQLIRRDGYQAVHAHTPRSALLGRLAAKIAGVPFIYHVHSPTSCDSTRAVQNFVNQWIERISLWGVSRIITVSQSLQRHMTSAGYQVEKISVVPNGVPTPANILPRSAPEGTWILGTVALMRPRKGTEVLLQAVAILREQGHDVRIRAVGPFETAEYEQALKSEAQKLEITASIDWTGFTKDVNAELAQMDLFVLPSLFGEGLPMVVLEAMAAGVPVVGTQVEGVPEAIRDGIDGVLAQPSDPQDLARQISRVIEGEVSWDKLRENALQRQTERFSARSMAQGVAEAYDRVLPVC
jgi:glycosyltransferase involved in cell wall biosynthesis